ncbi:MULTISPECIES: type II toxin-antitoxin system MqsA family antitoxin [Pseudomonas]|jgi:HTH-type transcriptional regulator/antitoxin MqsA|uniref:Antitoxin MqsA n=2 Tax=Pseudomonas TaxID=286 RepID=A0A109KM95_PSEFL|nr:MULTISPECIES: type II toxin-antitoxin system MqsA family antitoxin [Pseudomonas]KAA6196957.1 type II toxin-antitoxin system MqsA family antitoxin [Pseudomonas lactis]KRC91388.1 transcriptional regulator [Pseudomonas sp. Root9]KWV71858.1 Antitoxin MqsA [Pseudomonas fluorescens]MDY4298836.1 type II toxin-antitoxin system MqsA family antitoxin [Pseudomonas salmasensis]
MKTEQCFSCGQHDGMRHFSGRSETSEVKGLHRRIDNLSGWECQGCGEVIFDPEDADRYSDHCDEMVYSFRRMIGNEIKRIRRKLHLSQKDTVQLLSGGGHNALSRYERGELLAPKSLVVLMRLLDRHPHLLVDAKTLSEGADMRNTTHTTHKEHEIVTTP